MSTQPTTDVPTEEEIFESFLGRATPELSRRVNAYLKANPQKERELREWASIESAFQKFPLEQPNELILNRVRIMARNQANPSAATSWWQSVKAKFSVREIALVFSLLVAVGISQTVRQARLAGPERSKTTAKSEQNSDTKILATASDLAVQPTAMPHTPPTAEQITQELQDFDAAVTAYQSGAYENANQAFARIASENPNFEKRKDLYTYWVETLKKLGKYGLAEKKQKVLEEIERGNSQR